MSIIEIGVYIIGLLLAISVFMLIGIYNRLVNIYSKNDMQKHISATGISTDSVQMDAASIHPDILTSDNDALLYKYTNEFKEKLTDLKNIDTKALENRMKELEERISKLESKMNDIYIEE